MQIIDYPHPTLRRKSKPIKRVDDELRQIVGQMFELMYEAGGIGLAANQVDLPLRLFIVNLQARGGEGEEWVFLNPVISNPKGSEEMEEGCLSLPGLYGQVRRPKQVSLRAYNLQGQELVIEAASGLMGRVVQHELDHLDGVLFFDRMSTTGQMAIQDELKSFEAAFARLREAGQIPNDEQIAARLAEWEQKFCS